MCLVGLIQVVLPSSWRCGVQSAWCLLVWWRSQSGGCRMNVWTRQERRSVSARGADLFWVSGWVCLLQLEQVVDCADQAPFAVHGGQAAAVESAVAEVGFDVAEDRLDGVAAFLVELGVGGLGELDVHVAPGYRGIDGFAVHVRQHGVDADI